MRKGKIACIALYIAAGVSGLLYLAMRLSEGFSEFFNNTVGAASRWVFSSFSDLVPFSIVEAVVFLMPIIVVLVVVWLVKRIRRYGARGAKRVIATLFAVLCFFLMSFVFNGAAGYFCRSMADKLGFDEREITTDELIFCTENLVYEINEAAMSDEFIVDETGGTRNPYSIGDIARKVDILYDSFRDKYGFPQSFPTNPKLLASSALVTYTHISGLYCDYTGEININTNYPDFVVVSTVAHEMAHQRGVSPENEANFIAYAVLRESPDAYLRYSGALDAYMNVSSYLYKADKDSYFSLRARLCDTAKNDLAAFSAFFDKYRASDAAKVSSKINNTYLISQGTSGTISYDEATILIVKYQGLLYPEYNNDAQ